MAKTKSHQDQPGNDGAWFVEAVAPPSASTESGNGDAAPITETTLQLEPFEAWPQESPRQRRSRFAALAIVLAIIAAASVALVVWLSGNSQRQADELAADYQVALAEMRAVLPQTQQILGNVTDPFSDPDSLPLLEPLLFDLDAASDRVLDLASEPLPEPAPLASAEPFQALQPTRASMVLIGEEGLNISQRISDGLTYRVLIDEFIVLPRLPSIAAQSQINELEGELAVSLAQAQQTLEALPDDAAFTEHRQLAADALVEYEAWQDRYLDALRNGNQERALALIADVEQLVVGVELALEPALTRLRTEVDIQLLAVNDDIVVVLADIPAAAV